GSRRRKPPRRSPLCKRAHTETDARGHGEFRGARSDMLRADQELLPWYSEPRREIPHQASRVAPGTKHRRARHLRPPRDGRCGFSPRPGANLSNHLIPRDADRTLCIEIVKTAIKLLALRVGQWEG